VDKGHGRVEVRSLWTSTELRGYSYSAHGLWYPIQNAEDKTCSEWATPMRIGPTGPMGLLRRFYEAVE
jgi:hypothetical protein